VSGRSLEVGILKRITPAVNVTDYCRYQAGCWLHLRHIKKKSFLSYRVNLCCSKT